MQGTGLGFQRTLEQHRISSVREKKGIPPLSSPGTLGVCRSRGPAPAGADKTHLSLGNPTFAFLNSLHSEKPPREGQTPGEQTHALGWRLFFPPSLNFHGYRTKSGHSRLLPTPNSKPRKSTRLSALPAPPPVAEQMGMGIALPALPPVAGQMGTNEGFLLRNN